MAKFVDPTALNNLFVAANAAEAKKNEEKIQKLVDTATMDLGALKDTVEGFKKADGTFVSGLSQDQDTIIEELCSIYPVITKFVLDKCALLTQEEADSDVACLAAKAFVSDLC